MGLESLNVPEAATRAEEEAEGEEEAERFTILDIRWNLGLQLGRRVGSVLVGCA
ncbi:hypothetical protein F2Q69_00000916 [Brassica cretica]|uniref:Uncharacterized protein n=1 Tax=Brassica cretica TaxID=69181 RepID=A0A8S9P207_BRACR|nr:hypothetical protein F2Q69_00000916 [Brassica cretica]